MSSKIPIRLGDTLHCLNRGILKNDIFNTSSDWWRFMDILRYKNHDANIDYWHKTIEPLVDGHDMPWPENWSDQNPLVQVAAYTLMDNHYHLILKEINEGGVSSFMQKLGNSYTGYFQTKYEWDHKVFEGTYKPKHVSSRNQMTRLFVYVLVKNPFERYEGGIQNAIDNFDDAFAQAREYPFCSLGEVMGDREPLITDTTLFNEYFASPQEFKAFARDQMNQYGAFLEEIDDKTLE